MFKATVLLETSFCVSRNALSAGLQALLKQNTATSPAFAKAGFKAMEDFHYARMQYTAYEHRYRRFFSAEVFYRGDFCGGVFGVAGGLGNASRIS